MKNSSHVATLFLLGLLTISHYGQQPLPTATPPPDDDSLKISTTLVKIDVIATDKNGKQVTDLRPEDLSIYQDGKLQTITNLSYINSQTRQRTEILSAKNKGEKGNDVPPPPANVRSETGRLVTFILADHCGDGENAAFMRDSLRKFVDEYMLPEDRVAIYRTEHGASLLQVYTSNKDVLRKKIGNINFRSSVNCGDLYEKLPDPQVERNLRNPYEWLERENAPVIAVLNFVIDRLKSVPLRKTIFLLVPPLGMIGTAPVLSEIVDKALRASVVINTMSTGGVTIPSDILDASYDGPPSQMGPPTGRRRMGPLFREGQSDFAESTGGVNVRGKNSLQKDIAKILDEQTSYYLVSYEPDDETFKGKGFHKIEVRVNRPDLRISSRAGFFGVSDIDLRPVYKTANSPLYQALGSLFQDNSMEIGLTILHGNSIADGNFIRPLFHLRGEDLTLADEPNGDKKIDLDVVAVTLDEKGKVADEFNRTYTTHIPKDSIPLVLRNGIDFFSEMRVRKPGVYSFRIAVRDNASKRLAAATDVVEIKDVNKKDFFISGLITTGATENERPLLPQVRPANAAFSFVSTLSAPSIRRFDKGAILYYSYTVYNAKVASANRAPNLTRQIRLYYNGKLILDGPETQISAVVPQDPLRIEDLGNIRISNSAEIGEYALQVIVRDKIANRISAQWIDFEVVN